MELTQELVKELFDYHEDGYLIWRKRGHRIIKGGRVGHLTPMPRGERYKVGINHKKYLVSRVIFLWHKGYLPKYVEHKDIDRLNNKIQNLREATHSQNQKNKNSAKGSTSKYLGVCLMDGKYWIAQIKTANGKLHLGSFKTEAEAALCYNEAAIKYHGEFANPNIIEFNLL